ncbi:fasciclin domain-containing protein [Aquimarina algicola]|uniref:Fasciclin domain-containing protein n=1 Tax=Aquimarina algicola TaxID=2589995 RepID=A0A504IZM8_9FLAO|nr:fasciclin domain-containing protein [Aquimarina algicola]TPN83986.1 fasciclin domain-containing protein [Aquimarina algicola]
MKNVFKIPILFLVCMVGMMIVSCENNSQEEISEENNIEFPESKLISFDEIEKMTSGIIPGETAYNKQALNASTVAKNEENINYYFYGNVREGSRAGTNLSGELNLTVTFYGDVFRVLRGSFVSGSGEVSEARGAIIADGTVYLILELPDSVLVYGVGRENPENGGITGRFSLFTTDGEENKGSWIANIKDVAAPGDTILDLLRNNSRFSFATLVAALEATGLSSTVSGTSPLTVFAPTDTAFDALATLPDGDALRDVLLNHVVAGKFDTRAIINNAVLQTQLQNSNITIDFNGNGTLVLVNGTTQIILSNIEASNGYIHVIDAVLIP